MVDLRSAEIDPRTMTQTIFDTVGRPVEHASLFYILYYLIEIEDEEAAEFDFETLTSDLYDGMRYYALFSIMREASNVRNRYEIQGDTLAELSNSGRDDVIEAHVLSKAPRGKVDDVLEYVTNPVQYQSGQSDFANVANGFLGARNFHGLKDDPEDFVRTISIILQDFDNITDRSNVGSGTGWLPQYNGTAWGGIVEHLNRSDDLGPVAWVDQAFGIEHNTNNWLDKIRLSEEEKEILATSPNDYVRLDDPDLIDRNKHTNILVRVLNANRRGDMLSVLASALDFNDRISINLARFRPLLRDRRLDISATTLEQFGDYADDEIIQFRLTDATSGGLIEAEDDGGGRITALTVFSQVPSVQEEEVFKAFIRKWESRVFDQFTIARVSTQAVDGDQTNWLSELGYRVSDDPPFDLEKFQSDPEEPPSQGATILGP